jgi:cardiolipin synthase
LNLPNAISFGRLVLVPLIVWLLLGGHYAEAFWTFVAAGVSDAVDGLLARRLGLKSAVGDFLDPLADKVLLVSVYVTLGYQEHIATWLVILVVFRDLIIIGGAFLIHIIYGPFKPSTLFISKVNTTAQIILAAVVLSGLGLDNRWPMIEMLATYTVALTTLLSGGAYVTKWARRTDALEPGHDQ